jgi:hypothetical protein
MAACLLPLRSSPFLPRSHHLLSRTCSCFILRGGGLQSPDPLAKQAVSPAWYDISSHLWGIQDGESVAYGGATSVEGHTHRPEIRIQSGEIAL